MPRDPNIPDAFDVFTLVLLRRPADAPEMPDEELDALQARHLAYRAELRRQGLLVVNGPLGEQSDELCAASRFSPAASMRPRDSATAIHRSRPGAWPTKSWSGGWLPARSRSQCGRSRRRPPAMPDD